MDISVQIIVMNAKGNYSTENAKKYVVGLMFVIMNAKVSAVTRIVRLVLKSAT